MNGSDRPREVGLAEAVAETLIEHRQQRSGQTLDVVTTMAEQLSDDVAASEVELVLCRVALTSELVAAGVSSWLPASWVEDLQHRAVDWFLLVAKQALTPQAEGIERWLLALGPSLARLPVISGNGQLDVLVQVAARLGSLRLDAVAVADLVEVRRAAAWGPDARAGVLTAALELDHLLGHLDFRPIVEESDQLLSCDELGGMARDRLSEALAAHRHRPLVERPTDRAEVSDDSIVRAVSTFQVLLNAGDYAGAAMSAERLRDGPARIALVGANLRSMAQLHDGILDSSDELSAELARLNTIARLPESIELERTAPLASPGAMLREIAAYGIGTGTAVGYRSAALALEIIADARVARVAAVAAGERLAESLATVALDRRDGSTLPSNLGYRDGDPPEDLIHVAELTLDEGAALLAVSHINVARGRANGHVAGLFGTDIRLLQRLLRHPQQAERLRTQEADRLGRLVFGPLADERSPVVIPSPKLWSLPFERLLPGAWVAMSATSRRDRTTRRPPDAALLRVCFLGDPALPGAESERTALRQLAAQDKLHLVEVPSLRRLHDATRREEPDVLALAIHGSGDSLTYELALGNERLPAHELLGVAMPSTVVAASCSSGARGGLLNLATILYGGTPNLVVSLWDIDDQAAGRHLGTFYEALAVTRSAPAAWARLPAEARLSGLRLLTSLPEPGK